MATDQELALKMLDAIEDMYLENNALRAMLATYQKHLPSLGPWQRLLADLKAEPGMASNTRLVFAPLRKRIQEDQNLTGAIGEFLRVVPPKKDVN